MLHKNVTCNSCGTVYFAVTREWAEKEVAHARVWLAQLPPESRQNYGPDLRIEDYERCWCKNSYKNFRDAMPGDCPDGCTLSSILDRGQ